MWTLFNVGKDVFSAKRNEFSDQKLWETTHVLCKQANKNETLNKTWVQRQISAGMWIFCRLLFFVSYTPYVDLFNAELNKYNEYKSGVFN